MANSGPHTNGCQFFITTAPADFLDGKHVVFGKILDDPENMLILRKIENVPTGPNNRPKLPVKIVGMSFSTNSLHVSLTFTYLICRVRRNVKYAMQQFARWSYLLLHAQATSQLRPPEEDGQILVPCVELCFHCILAN